VSGKMNTFWALDRNDVYPANTPAGRGEYGCGVRVNVRKVTVFTGIGVDIYHPSGVVSRNWHTIKDLLKLVPTNFVDVK
jgi:hypothetical protein